MNRKGITPVIAVVLLLMMTVAAAGAAFFWMTTIQSRIQGQIGTQVTTTSAQTSASINFLATICNASSGDLNITLQNTGTTTIENGTVGVILSDDQDRVLKVGNIGLGSNFDQNNIITLNIDGFDVITENETYGVKVALPGGVITTTDCTAQD